MLRDFLNGLFGPSSTFSPGDSVEPLQGGKLMVVKNTGLDPQTREKVVFCTWFDLSSSSSVTGSFRECDLKLIDWYQRDTKPSQVSPERSLDKS